MQRGTCNVCNKKLTFIDEYICKCGLIVCLKHRYPFAHNCKMDVRKEFQSKLTKILPVVTSEKIAKI